MKKTLSLLFCMLLLANIGFSQAKKRKAGKLDKKTYTCAILIKGKKKVIQDDLKFQGGTMSCKTMLDEGFKTSDYEATVDSSTTPVSYSFSCQAKDGEDNQFYWSGTVTGDDIQGSATVSDKKGKVKKEYTFSGSIKGKKI